jgi:energy-coupling factor transporter ATP-binding protein EcfA2
MSKDTRSPNVAAIRQLLLAAFTPEDLRRFCEDRDPFKSLLDRFASPNRLDQMVDEVVTYCEKQNLFDELLAQVEGANPRQYAAQARKLGLPQAGAGLDLACPYRGLEPFQAEHAEFFFGREAMVDALVAKVAETRFVAVVGPSGSGKSSLVRAGLVPALQDGALPGSHQWGLEIFRPGADPLRSLAGAFVGRLYPGLDRIERMVKARELANYMQRGDLPLDDILKEVREDLPPRARLLLIADQFEETFTACGDEELRRSFVETLLAAAAGSWLSVLLTLRADFFGHVLKEPGLDRFVDAGQFNVLTMTRQELRTAIEGPADAVGCRFEPGLVERILDDVAAAPGRLPLLQFALTLLWQRGAARGVLTHAAYEAIGEVPGAIAQHADGVLGELSSADQERVREILTRLVRLARPEEGAEDTRLRVERSELDEEIQPLVDRLANARLIVTGREPVTGEPTVELAHEALIRHWQRLRDWLDDDRKNLQIRQGVRQATREWLRNARDGGYLVHRARRLDEAIALL